MANHKNKTSSKQSPPSDGCPQDGVGNSVLTIIESIPIKRKLTPLLPANKDLKSRARALRKMGNRPEIVFWQQVHKRKFYNVDFDRQRIIGNFIVDFYVKGLSLIIEIDGASHNEKEAYDRQREKYLKNLGLHIWKVSSTEVLMDVDRVMENLKSYIIKNYS